MRAFPIFLDNYILAVYGPSGSNLRGCNRGIFSLGGKLTRSLPDRRAFTVVVTRGLRFVSGSSVSLAARLERRSMRRGENTRVLSLHCQTRQCDVTSVVYARQRHPRTARLQLNDIAGLERLCHDLILANVTLCPSF